MARTIVVDVDAVDPTRIEEIAKDIQKHYPDCAVAFVKYVRFYPEGPNHAYPKLRAVDQQPAED